MFNKNQLHFTLFLAASCTLFSVMESAPGPAYLPYECTKALDCGPGECCVIGMMRYSFPTCLRFGKEGDYCFGTSQPKNVTLHYPNGLALELSDVHTLFCPCDASMALSCQQGTCQSEMINDIGNQI